MSIVLACYVPDFKLSTSKHENRNQETVKNVQIAKMQACCHVLNVIFTDQKRTKPLFGGDGTLGPVKKKSRDNETGKTTPLWKNSFR